MDLIILPPVGQTAFFSLGEATSLEEGKVRQFVRVFHPIHYYGSIAFVRWEDYDTVIIL